MGVEVDLGSFRIHGQGGDPVHFAADVLVDRDRVGAFDQAGGDGAAAFGRRGIDFLDAVKSQQGFLDGLDDPAFHFFGTCSGISHGNRDKVFLDVWKHLLGNGLE